MFFSFSLFLSCFWYVYCFTVSLSDHSPFFVFLPFSSFVFFKFSSSVKISLYALLSFSILLSPLLCLFIFLYLYQPPSLPFSLSLLSSPFFLFLCFYKKIITYTSLYLCPSFSSPIFYLPLT
jgi:hypothetical protein